MMRWTDKKTHVGLANAVGDVVVGLLKGAVVRRTVSVARHDDGLFYGCERVAVF